MGETSPLTGDIHSSFLKHSRRSVSIRPWVKSSREPFEVTVRQLVYDRTAIGVRPYGNCRSTVWQLPYDNLSRDLWQLSPFPIWVHRMFCQPTDLSFVTALFVSAVFAIWLLPNLSIGDGREPAAAATDGARAMLSPHSHTSDKNFVVVGTTVFLVWICQDR